MPLQRIFKKPLQAFTLIELLIVVAIIAILAAIAVPNFLEAQSRSKISRCRSDLRNVATALEAYRVDNNKYPPTPFVLAGDAGVMRVLPNLISTPVAYVSTANLYDMFTLKRLADFQCFTRTGGKVFYAQDTSLPMDPGGGASDGKRYYYQNNNDPRRTSFAPTLPAAIAAQETEGQWVTSSIGPDEMRSLLDPHPVYGVPYSLYIPYDASNGTVSVGDIIRTQRFPEGSLTK